VRRFIRCTLPDQIKIDEMGRICSMHGRSKKRIQFNLEIMKERDHLGDIGLVTI